MHSDGGILKKVMAKVHVFDGKSSKIYELDQDVVNTTRWSNDS